ncbi:MAG: PH domain-containing protein [Acidobacteriota bacterium]
MTSDAGTPPPLSPAPLRSPEAPVLGFERLDPRALTLGLLGGAISWLFFAVPITFGVLMVGLFADQSSVGSFTVLGLGIGALLILAVLQIGLQIPRFKRYRYRADESGLEIHRGVLWRSRIFIPRSRIQHTDVNQGPIERQLGLAKLVVHTAGTVRASTTISGLAHAVALDIRASLSEDDAGTDGV